MKLLLIALILGIGSSCIFYLDSVMQPLEPIERVQIVEEYIEEAETVSLGEFEITHYCDCPICCGEWSDGITATGTVATPDRTVAVDPSVIPLGSKVLIDGHTYIAEDTGSAIKGNRLDVFVATHEEGISRGRVERGVYLVNE